MKHLHVLPGGRIDPDTPYYKLAKAGNHPVLEAHFATDGEPPRMAQLAVSVLYEAVKRNDRNEAQAQDALEVLGAYFSKPAGVA